MINSLRDLQYVSIYPEKHRLKYCQRSSTLFMCHFITSNLPFDEQNCYFEIESRKFNKNQKIDLFIE